MWLSAERLRNDWRSCRLSLWGLHARLALRVIKTVINPRALPHPTLPQAAGAGAVREGWPGQDFPPFLLLEPETTREGYWIPDSLYQGHGLAACDTTQNQKNLTQCKN